MSSENDSRGQFKRQCWAEFGLDHAKGIFTAYNKARITIMTLSKSSKHCYFAKPTQNIMLFTFQS